MKLMLNVLNKLYAQFICPVAAEARMEKWLGLDEHFTCIDCKNSGEPVFEFSTDRELERHYKYFHRKGL